MAYKVPFVDLPTQYKRLEKELKILFDDVLFTRADFIMRSDLREFERVIAEYVGTKYAVGLNSGFDALLLSVKATGLGQGDEVITVAHTFVATVAAIVHCNATPVLVDVGKDHNMDMDQLEKAITPRTKGIIPVHLNGRVCDMDRLMDIAAKHKLIVIEDAAQALGANFGGKKAGSFGLTGCFSLYPMKMLGGAGDGGIIATDDENIAQEMRLLRDHCQNRETGEITGYGFNSRLDNIQAAILNLKFKYLPQWIERRRELASIYNKGLSDISQIDLPASPQARGKYFDVFQNYAICVHERDKLVNYLKEECSVEVLISWPVPMHFHKALKLDHFKLPVTERISREVVSLPMNTEISNKEAEYVIDCLRSFYKK